MADVQKHFEEFNRKIKLGRFEENAILRDKRDIVLDKLKTRLKEMFEEIEETPPSFTPFDQGSYVIGTGTQPVDGDFDIDEGIIFDISKNDYPDPIVVKGWVYDALYGHTDDVCVKQPCVTVQYHIDKEPVYHVDLPIYAHDGSSTGEIFLARGKLNSEPENRYWQSSDPQGLCSLINERFSGDDAKQFRRTIRYLKRWRDVQFPSRGNASPVGIGITVAAYNWFQPKKHLIDPFAGKYKYDDRAALEDFVQQMLGRFIQEYYEDEVASRLSMTVPATPYDNPFARMTNIQMSNFKDKLESLRDALNNADEETDSVEACKTLHKQFGDDFTVPEKVETAQRRTPAILTTSESA